MQSASSSKGGKCEVSYPARMNSAGGEVDIIIQVGQMPLKSRCVGQHAECVFVEMDLSFCNLYHDLAPCLFGYSPMYGGTTRVDAHHMYQGHCGFQFINRFEIAQYPRHQLEITHGLRLEGFVICFVLPISREIEQPCFQSRLVHPVHDKLRLLYRQPDIAVFGGKPLSVLCAIRKERLLFMPSRDNDIAAIECFSRPLDGSCRNHVPLLRLKRNARTGVCVRETRRQT